MQQPIYQRPSPGLRQCPHYAGESRKSVSTPGGLRTLRHLARDDRRPQRPLSPVVGGLDTRIVQEAQQIAAVVVPPQFVEQAPVVGVLQRAVPQMVGDSVLEVLRLGGKASPLAVVVGVPHLYRLAEQALKAVAEGAGRAMLLGQHRTERALDMRQALLLAHPSP